MQPSSSNGDRRAILLFSSLGAFIGGLCCLTPIAAVLLGLSTVAAANSLGNSLYGEYKWHFRAAAAIFLTAALVVYFRKRGICTLDQARRQRNRILNTVILTVLAAVSVYTIWNYIVLHYWGIAAGLPWAQWDESWAIPLAAGLIAATLAAALWLESFLRKLHQKNRD
jgi:hypothetical protein